MWATGFNSPDMEDKLNSYLEEITAYLNDNTLLISAPKVVSNIVHPGHTSSENTPENSHRGLPAISGTSPKILGVHLDTSLSFNKYYCHVAVRVSSRNNILRDLAGEAIADDRKVKDIIERFCGDLFWNTKEYAVYGVKKELVYGGMKYGI